MNFDSQKTIFLIDGSSFLYRAYYGLNPLHTSKGVPIQAVYAFCRMIQKLIKKFNPQYMALVWDSKGKTARHELYQEYKATRQQAPSDLFEQKEYIREFADLIGLFQIEQQGAEADDLMYSIAKDYEQKGYTSVLITSDKDMGQTITNQIVLYDSFKDVVVDAQAFVEKMGFPVWKLPFYFALLGDSSDNIPGVKGIGKKGATDLVQQFDSLEDLYARFELVTKKAMRATLEENKKDAFLSRDLFLLKYYTTDSSLQNLAFDANNWPKARPLFEMLEFKSLVKEISTVTGESVKQIKLSEEKGYIFETITTQESLGKLCSDIKAKKLVALDTELTGLDPLKNDLVGISACLQKGHAYYIPFGHITQAQQLSREVVLNAFKPIMEDISIKKVMHHAKFDQLAFLHYNIKPKGLIFDTLIAAHLVTQDWQRIGLKHLSQFYLHESMISFSDAVLKNGYKSFADVPLDIATEYAASDAHQTMQLYPILQQELEKQNMVDLYNTIEFPLVDILLHMEYRGIFCDTNILHALGEHIAKELATIQNKIIALCGEQYKGINLNSPKQLGELLFEHLQLPPQKKTIKKTGYSTDQEVLEKLALMHPVPALIVQYRVLYKLLSTYIEALPTYINPETKKIHTTFSQTAVATGRLASSDPNLQNIPTNSYEYKGQTIRSAFKPPEDHIFLSADYSQIELRVLAYLSQDRVLIDAFLQNEDIHQRTASHIFDVPMNEVTYDQRQIGKRINFSILYGLTPYGLSQDLKISFADARKYIEKYFAQYPGVSAWMENVIEETKKNGYVTTFWGRRRYIPTIYEQNRTLYDAAKRIAINTKAQGTAAELMKLGMINLSKILQEQHIDAHIILQIHDELLIAVPRDQQELVANLVKDTLENIVSWNVPLQVTIRFGNDWQEVTK